MSLTNAPLEKAFVIIKQQTSYRVIYDNSLLENAKPVTIFVEKAPLLNVLMLLFRSQPFEYQIMDQSIILTPLQSKTGTVYHEARKLTPHAEDSLITGFVVEDSSLLPLSGASIQVKGTSISATTDNAGRFQIRIPQHGATLIISYVEYSTKNVQINEKSLFPLNVFLTKTSRKMDEVTIVSTGYESLPKERATGSFSKVDNATLNQQIGTFILNRLVGVANGILFDQKLTSPQKKMNLTIRGLSTINGPTDPLIVLDNFPYEGDLNNINPNDIENITILKDAAAASIWGTRAGNGVIVITTKRGRYNQPLKIEFNLNTTIAEKPDLFFLPQMSSADYIGVEQYLFNRNYYNGQINSTARTALSPAVEIFLNKRNNLISPTDSALQINALKDIDVRNEYNRYFYRKAVNQQYSLNLYGGSGNVAYYISGGYDKNISNNGSKYDRINVRLENSYRPVKNLQLTLGVLYTNSKNKGGKPVYNSVTVNGRPIPYLSFADTEGNPIAVARNYREIYTDTAGNGKLLNWKYYPLEDYRHNRVSSKLQDLVTNIRMKYTILEGIDFNVNYQYERQQATGETLQDIESYATRNIINLFTQIDKSSGEIKYNVPLGDILNLSNSTVFSQNIRAQLSINKSLKNHTIASLFGAESRSTISELNTNIIYGYDDDLLTASSIDFVNPYPTYLTGFRTYIGNGLSFSKKTNRFISYFGNVAYAFKEKYTISGSFRKDASNLFGVKANDRWNPFWSFGSSWDIAKEQFYKSAWINTLRVRTSYGVSGNVDQSKSAVTVIGYQGNNSITGFPQAQVGQFANPYLSWEKVKTFNVGIDFSLFNKAIIGSIEYYKKKGYNLFGTSPVDYTAGVNTNVLTRNAADMSSDGMDIMIQTVNINRAFKWFTTLLVNYNLSKTEKYYLPEDLTDGSFISNGNTINPTPGRPLYSIISYRWGGLDPMNGNPQGYVDGKLSTDYAAITNSLTKGDSLVYSGSALPKYFGAISNTIRWKGISLTVNLSYKLGYYFRKPSINYSTLYASGVGHSDYSQRWQKPSDELKTNVPSQIYPVPQNRDAFYLFSETTVRRGDHVRVQFANITYDISKSAFKNLPFKSIQLYLNASNIGLIWRANKDHLDPEFSNTIPPARTYAFGIRSSF
ncbi:SusC/RagA family TonB-linked outer membrane protein [Agriterribacter sp.]|uniref:SusC/RagA family TonB-linked outer membrane protein n=1 Tax=Agriterribacter sp. TaxID=2821509 RepID=UPI002CA7ED76|nr:SusC/RagA family TonB-linked outer membrane protein [Agriterribacter sp.]HTN05989.1 SusC/RagA family TonB-linked outer membrane protein [Agriterribacter sp.]